MAVLNRTPLADLKDMPRLSDEDARRAIQHLGDKESASMDRKVYACAAAIQKFRFRKPAEEFVEVMRMSQFGVMDGEI